MKIVKPAKSGGGFSVNVVKPKVILCERCHKNPIESNSNLAKYCNACKSTDPYYNTGRKTTIADGRKSRARPEMIVHVDSEGDGNGGIISASYGREDGSSDSIITSDPVKIFHWWMENLCGSYIGADGVAYRQIIGAFHFNYDTAVLAKFMDKKVGTLRLIHKSKTKGDNSVICNLAKCKCEKPYHAFSATQTVDVITMGGEGNVITYDPETHIAIAATPKRRLYVEYRPKGWDYAGSKILDIHDMGTAFVGGLEAVIDTWQPELTQSQHEVITWGKKARKDDGKFEGASNERIAAYSEAECVAAARCARLLIKTISEAAGIKIKAYELFGSGSLAAAAFREHKLTINKHSAKDESTDWIPWLDYFGGMIETPIIGIVRGKAHEEDLNSAYPAAMIHLPCRKNGHGYWKHIKRFGAPEAYGITEHTLGHVLMDFWNVETPSTPPFMVRDKQGSVYQPLRGRNTWVTMPEYVAAVNQFGLARIQAKQAVIWVQKCDCPPPLAWLHDLFEKRRMIKLQMRQLEKGSPEWWRLNVHQEAIKLVINSCYGKLAQRRPTIGRYTDLHYASHITGATRAKVRERTWRREKNGSIVIYQHTDSVLSVGHKPPTRDIGEKLGEWGLEDKNTEDAFILQPGLMTGLKAGKSATRGVAKSVFKECAESYAAARDLSQHPTEWEDMVVPTRRMISRKAAISIRRKPEMAGIFEDSEMALGPSWTKRDLENAYPVPGQPEAWFVPPIEYVDNAATLEDVEKMQNALVLGGTDGDDTETIIGPDEESDYTPIEDAA